MRGNFFEINRNFLLSLPPLIHGFSCRNKSTHDVPAKKHNILNATFRILRPINLWRASIPEQITKSSIPEPQRGWKLLCITIKAIGIALLAGHSASAFSNEFDDLTGSENSTDFTSAERALLVDTPDRFTKYEIPREIIAGELFWLDNERLVFSSRHYGQWNVEPDEQLRIISYNVVTGELVDSGYRGKLKCLNHLGDVLIHSAEGKTKIYSPLKNHEWFTGKWGKSLQKIDYVQSTSIPRYLCKFVPYGPPIFITPPEEFPEGTSKIIPLLPEHGSLKETVVRKNGELEENIFLIAADKREIWLRDKRLSKFRFVYQPWDKSYFEAGTARNPPYTIFPSGKILRHPPPKLIRYWIDNQSASAGGYSSKPGIIWDVQQGYSYWKKQGLYLEKDGELIRIDTGTGYSHVQTSPNGCLIFSEMYRGNFFIPNKDNHAVVIDLCQESKK